MGEVLWEVPCYSVPLRPASWEKEGEKKQEKCEKNAKSSEQTLFMVTDRAPLHVCV